MRRRRELQQLTIDGNVEVVASVVLSPKWGGARKGAGRPKGKARTRTISCRISEELYNLMEIRACQTDQSISAYLSYLIEESELSSTE